VEDKRDEGLPVNRREATEVTRGELGRHRPPVALRRSPLQEMLTDQRVRFGPCSTRLVIRDAADCRLLLECRDAQRADEQILPGEAFERRAEETHLDAGWQHHLVGAGCHPFGECVDLPVRRAFPGHRSRWSRGRS
jgi:hypothetical protein